MVTPPFWSILCRAISQGLLSRPRVDVRGRRSRRTANFPYGPLGHAMAPLVARDERAVFCERSRVGLVLRHSLYGRISYFVADYPRNAQRHRVGV